MVFDLCGRLTVEEAIVEDFGVRLQNAKRLIKQYIQALKSLSQSGVYFEVLVPDSIRINQNLTALFLLDIPFILDGPSEKVGSGYLSVYSPPETLLKTVFMPEKAMVWSVGVLLYKLYHNRYPFSGKPT